MNIAGKLEETFSWTKDILTNLLCLEENRAKLNLLNKIKKLVFVWQKR